MSGNPRPVYLFGAFRLEPGERRLCADGKPVPLPPRVFDTLVALVERRGRLVEKEELLRVVWEGVFVDDANVSVNISTLRKALGETDQGTGYIETVPRKGYRFIGKVTEEPWSTEAAPAADVPTRPIPAALPAPAEPVTANRRSAWPRGLAAALALVALAGAGFLLVRFRAKSRSGRPAVRSIAVLPFLEPGASPDEGYFGVGLADALISRLSSAKGAVVRPTSAVVRFVGSKEDPAAIGRALGVDAVVTGLIQRSGAEVRVTAQLVACSDGRSFWAESVRERSADLFTLQDVLSGRLARALTLDLTGASAEGARRPTESREAYELYLRGRFHWFRWTPEDWARAREYFERAIALDPGYAAAYAGLSEAIGVQGFVTTPSEVAPRSKELAQKAIELDPSLAAGHIALGPIQFFYDRDWLAAEATYRRALELDPNAPMAHDLYGILLVATGRLDEGIAEARKALALDPGSSYLAWDLGEALYHARRYPEARDQLARTLELDPGYFEARFLYATTLERLGREADAVDETLRALRESGTNAGAEAALREAYARGGRPGYWRARLTTLEETALTRYVSPYRIAVHRMEAGDRAGALAALLEAERGRAYQLVRVAVDPVFDALKDEPAFLELLARMKLPRRAG